MSKLTFISQIENIDGVYIDFFRFSCKKYDTVVKKHIDALVKNHDFWIRSWVGGVTLAIYETPDGYNTNEKPIFKIALADIIKQSERVAENCDETP